ncbi:hypothetical protein AAFF_G00230880 [Aldrovandia affinis]|uniref:Uncharacterized protein n=1 Tax=Aldrovandia affinis TaxID=143900 RepID=A0AAD7W4H9_9TELE|nr:hypothetical protein AAFF_G00230880 [Aldrovandia affinis]
MTASLDKACHRCLSQIASNAFFVFGLLAFLALPLTMAYVGVKTIDDCPVQPMIPLYLLVGGVVGSIKVTFLLYDITRLRALLSKSVIIGDDDDDEYPWRQNAHKYHAHIVLSAFLFVWFVLGNYWVFSVYAPNFIPPFHRPHEYCRKSLVAELVRLVDDLSSLAGISAHNMWLFMTWRAEVLNSHLLAFVTDVRAKKGLVGGLEKEVGGLEKEGAKAATAMVNEVGVAVGVATEVGVAIAQAEKMVPAEAGEPNMIPAEAGEPNMMMTTMYDAAAAAEESGNTDGEGGLSVAEGQTLKGSWREASGSLATPVSSLKSPLFGRGLNAA